jgi:hypothetical protein
MLIFDELKRPFNAFTTAMAAVGIALSIYFGLESRQKREPYFIAHETSQIYNKKNPSPKLNLIDQSGTKIDGDVHVIEVSFWNKGRQSIEPSDIRTPILMEFPAGTHILDFSVVRQNKPDITQFRLLDAPTKEASQSQLSLQWLHLDPGLGAHLQVIYIGEKNPNLVFKGDILDAEIANGAALIEYHGFGRIVTIIFSFALASIASYLVEAAGKRVPASKSPVWKLLYSLAICAPLALFTWFLLIRDTAPV